MIVTLVNCKQNFSALGVSIDESGGWDKLRNEINNKVSLITSNYDITQDVLTIEVSDGITLPDLSEFGTVTTNASTTN